jgi:hypothetical protein
MLKRLLLCLFLLTAVTAARATDYTDLYFVATEPGSGYNVVQSDNFIFITFFIYGPDKTPTWYTAQLTLDVSGNFNGPLYATIGTFYGSPYSMMDSSIGQVGTASFQPTGPYSAKLVYIVTSPPNLAATVTKLIQRQSLPPSNLAGTYIGAQTGAYSGCGPGGPYANGPYQDTYTVQVAQTISGDVTFNFAYDSGLNCSFSGTLTQYGQLYAVYGAAYTCDDGLNTMATMSELRATSLGMEGRFAAPNEGGGCGEAANFGGPLK